MRGRDPQNVPVVRIGNSALVIVSVSDGLLREEQKHISRAAAFRPSTSTRN
jgi:hypothetical protein